MQGLTMEKLNFQDASFLRLESSRHPFHVGGLMILKKPPGASSQYLRRLAARSGQLNEVWPIFNKKLGNPDDPANAGWVVEDNYHPERHVLHYALPRGGRMEDLLALVSRAHERQLDRGRPLWELHLIEGLSDDRFAIYCKVHHALVDGVGALGMLKSLFTTSRTRRFDLEDMRPHGHAQQRRHKLLAELGDMGRALRDQYRALPQLSALLSHMGLDALTGEQESMKLPFTGPRSIFNTQMDSSRQVVICDLSFKQVRKLAQRTGGTINDVLLAVCGGALRQYLLGQDALPGRSLVAGVPVSLKSSDEDEGNRLSFILCPFFTTEKDDYTRLQRVIKTTRKAKAELGKMSTTANQDFTNLILMPTILLTLTGNATRVTPAINAIFSNVPGPAEKLYLEGAELESLYPLSVVTDGMGINLTVISYCDKLCFAITSCPTEQPEIGNLGNLLKASFRSLQLAVKQRVAA
jgi:WS/DGAT/MGAT family acyltransferase